MSALPPKADIRQRIEHVCFVPLAEIFAVERPQPHERRRLLDGELRLRSYRMLADAFGLRPS